MKAYRARTQSAGASGGFSLLEVMLVVIIMGIIVGMALPVMNSVLTEARLNAAVSELAVALEFAQLTALSTGRRCRVTVDPAAETLLIEESGPSVSLLGTETQLAELAVETEVFAAIEHPMRRFQDYVIDFTATDQFAGVDIVSAVFGIGNFVEFDALGAPSIGGNIIVRFGDFQTVLQVDAVSGKVTQI